MLYFCALSLAQRATVSLDNRASILMQRQASWGETHGRPGFLLAGPTWRRRSCLFKNGSVVSPCLKPCVHHHRISFPHIRYYCSVRNLFLLSDERSADAVVAASLILSSLARRDAELLLRPIRIHNACVFSFAAHITLLHATHDMSTAAR